MTGIGKRKEQRKASVFRKADKSKMLHKDSPFAVVEAYNSIRTNLMFLSKNEKCPMFAVTSAVPGDGKTTNCVNLAISFANMGKKTLIIDADMRNPTVHRFFYAPMKNGLSELLAGINKEINIRPSGLENLSLLTAGTTPPNPTVLLSSTEMCALSEKLKAEFDYIFVDTPPVEVVSDAAALAEKVTGYILIVNSGESELEDIRYSCNALEQVGGTIAGFILNGFNYKDGGYGKLGQYSYRYAYRGRYSYHSYRQKYGSDGYGQRHDN